MYRLNAVAFWLQPAVMNSDVFPYQKVLNAKLFFAIKTNRYFSQYRSTLFQSKCILMIYFISIH